MQKQVSKLYIVRHGESEYNRDGIINGGHSDPKLTDSGKKQAQAAKASLKDIKFDTVYSSDLQRARHTAAIIYGRAVPKSHQLAGLRERHFGVLEGKPDHHLDNMYANTIALTPDERWLYRHAEGMENDKEFAARVVGALETIAQDNLGKTVLVVAHGGCMRMTLIKLGFADHAGLPAGSFKNTGWIELTYDGKEMKVGQIEGLDHQAMAKRRKNK